MISGKRSQPPARRRRKRKREAPACILCGATERLQPDAELEDVYYCERCWQRYQLQQRAIDEGYEPEPQVEM